MAFTSFCPAGNHCRTRPSPTAGPTFIAATTSPLSLISISTGRIAFFRRYHRLKPACGASRDELRATVKQYLDNELGALVANTATHPPPTCGFQRVVQRAILHVQSSGRDEVTGANFLVALFSERESYAVYFLQQQDMSRLDAVSYISHGVGKGETAAEPQEVKGADEGKPEEGK